MIVRHVFTTCLHSVGLQLEIIVTQYLPCHVAITVHSQFGVRDSCNAAIVMWGKLRASRPLSLSHNTMAKVEVYMNWQDNSLSLY